MKKFKVIKEYPGNYLTDSPKLNEIIIKRNDGYFYTEKDLNRKFPFTLKNLEDYPEFFKKND